MRHAVACCLLLLIVGTSSGAFAAISEALADGDACTEQCDEGQGGCCSPICDSCVCASRIASVVLPALIAVPAPERREADTLERVSGQPEAPDLPGILHVPIAA